MYYYEIFSWCGVFDVLLWCFIKIYLAFYGFDGRGGGERSDHVGHVVSTLWQGYVPAAHKVICIPFTEVNCATQTYYLYQRPFFTCTSNCYLSLPLVSQLTFSLTNKKDSKKKRNWLSSKDLNSSFGKVREMKLDLHCMECYPFLNLEPWPFLIDKWFSKYLKKKTLKCPKNS